MANISEEDIRTRIVYQWLRNRSIDVSQIQLETTFELRIGRGLFRVGSEQPTTGTLRPRADILVKSIDGRNLLIFEIKAPDEPLNDAAKEQGISYARLLKDGGIAPFVVLVNGQETRVYNSITGEEVSGGHIVTHAYLTHGIPLGIDDDDLRIEALEQFVSLSAENILAFCRNQIDYRMTLLRSEDPFSDKKYIPSLYVDRTKPRETLNELIQLNRPVILVTGSPQIGKTCFVCNTVEQLLEAGQPCLFFPAISMKYGLLAEIQEDFGWILGSSEPSSFIARKLNRILERINQTLTIVIDGLNEVDVAFAHSLSEECRRIHTDRIRFLISLTNIAAERLLVDTRGNVGFIAEASNVSQIRSVKLIEVSPELSKGNVVTISQYSLDEIEKVYTKYCNIYGVITPEYHIKTQDPFLLRLGMQQFAGSILPSSLDEPILLEQSIMRKFQRVPEISDDALRTWLENVARTMLDTEFPVSFATAASAFQRLDLPHSLYESALLSRSHTLDNKPAIDFYYGRERDFIIAYWVKTWTDTLPLRNQGETGQLTNQVKLACRTQVGLEAFSWFIQQESNSHIFDALLTLMFQPESKEALFQNMAIPLQLVVLRALRKPHQKIPVSIHNLSGIIKEGIFSKDLMVKTEAAKLFFEQGIDEDEIKEKFTENAEWLEAMLSIDDEYPFEDNDSPSNVILEALKDLHIDENMTYDDYWCESEISSSLEAILTSNSSARSGALKALAYVAPFTFFEEMASIIAMGTPHNLLGIAVNLGLEALHQHYFGGEEMLYCEGPSQIESLAMAPSQFRVEYDRISRVVSIVKHYLQNSELVEAIVEEFRRTAIRFTDFRDGFGDEVISGMLRDLIYDFDPEKRELAAEFFGEMRVCDAVPFLIGALKDSSWFVEKAAAYALYQIGTPEADKAYESWRLKLQKR